MKTIPLHHRALELTSELVGAVRPADLGRPTPCAGWDLAALLAHMTGQNHGFADALRGGTDVAAYAPVPGLAAWPGSVADLLDAVAHPGTDAVLLPEITVAQRFPVPVVIGFHLLDTVVHGWDVATSLGRVWRPEPPLVDAVLEQARLVPAGPARTAPGAAFAPALAAEGEDPWMTALALLGRSPGVIAG
jgi:uncharacterized protein (TIGR03086 family)